MIITRFNQLIQDFHRLAAGDVFIGQVPASPLKSAILADLTARGVKVLPGETAQLINASKAAQAFVLLPWMVPHTRVICRRKELLDALGDYARLGIDATLTKADRLHCGHGVCKWDSLDTLYGCVSMGQNIYPFVLQPFVEEFTDVRVIIVGEYCEAYSRLNPHGFRMNLAAGGQSRVYQLAPDQYQFCLKMMERSHMPYAHLDLMITPDQKCYVSEIRLNGGIHGARVTRPALDKMKQKQLLALARQSVAVKPQDHMDQNDTQERPGDKPLAAFGTQEA